MMVSGVLERTEWLELLPNVVAVGEIKLRGVEEYAPTKAADAQRALVAARVGNIRCGYRLAADRKHVEPDPAEQRVLSEIRQLRKDGHSMRRISTALNLRALRTPRATAWRLEHIARILNHARA